MNESLSQRNESDHCIIPIHPFNHPCARYSPGSISSNLEVAALQVHGKVQRTHYCPAEETLGTGPLMRLATRNGSMAEALARDWKAELRALAAKAEAVTF